MAWGGENILSLLWSSVGGLVVLKSISILISYKLASMNNNGVVTMGIVGSAFFDVLYSLGASIMTGGAMPP